MKNIRTKTTAALMMLAASAIPAFAQQRGQQGRGQQHGWDRGSQQQQQRPQYQQRSFEQRGSQGRDPMPGRPETRLEQRQFTQPQQVNRDSWQQRGQEYRQQDFRQQEYRGRNSPVEGDSRPHYRQNDFQNRFAAGGYRGYAIPQNRFYSSFGRDHFFRVGRPEFYGGYQRFRYGGYWFSFIDAPPAFWGQDWYDTDDVYIDYNDGGYYLYDSRYPDEGIPVEPGT